MNITTTILDLSRPPTGAVVVDATRARAAEFAARAKEKDPNAR